MQCETCSDPIDPGEERELHGRYLCEDCYMDALSQPRTCDPWAVYTAKSLEKHQRGKVELTGRQQEILAVLEQTGGMEPDRLAERLGMKIPDLQREIAALRHMEKVRGERRAGNRVFIVLW